MSRDADGIIAAALRPIPPGPSRQPAGNSLEQLRRFRSGDGLRAWPAQVTPWIEQDFPPRESAAYLAARQQRGVLAGAWRAGPDPSGRRASGRHWLCPVAAPCRAAQGTLPWLPRAVLLALPLSAVITGSSIRPHDRYQSRIMWLPPFVAVLSLVSFRPRPLAAERQRIRPQLSNRRGLHEARRPLVRHRGHVVGSPVDPGVVHDRPHHWPVRTGYRGRRDGGHVVLWVFVNALFADALVQRPAVNDRALSSAFWASTAVGCVAICSRPAPDGAWPARWTITAWCRWPWSSPCRFPWSARPAWSRAC